MARLGRKLLVTAIGICSAFCLSQDDDAPPIRVRSNQVVLLVSVLRKGFLDSPGSARDWDCLRADKERFSKLDPSQPYTPSDCAEDVFRG